MLVACKWTLCTDGFTRPMALLEVQDAAGALRKEWFLVDTGADFTVIAATTLRRLNLTIVPGLGTSSVTGIGGASATVAVDTSIVVTGTDGSVGHFKSRYLAFTSSQASDT